MATKKTSTAKAVKRTTRAAVAKTTSPVTASARTSAKKTVRRTSAPKVATRREDAAVDVNEHIAVAAYYRAERRGFAPGGELDDWLGAELSVNSR